MNQKMMDLMKYKWYYLIFSAVLLIPGIISLFAFGLDLSIDFTGGSVFKYEFSSQPSTEEVRQVFTDAGAPAESIFSEQGNQLTVRTKPTEPAKSDEIKDILDSKYENVKLLSFETVGPAIGTEKPHERLLWL
jgi:preprotein translocase subunit SecF